MIHFEIQAKTSIYQNIIGLTGFWGEFNQTNQINHCKTFSTVCRNISWMKQKQTSSPLSDSMTKTNFWTHIFNTGFIMRAFSHVIVTFKYKAVSPLLFEAGFAILILPLDQGELSFVAQLWLLPKARETIAFFCSGGNPNRRSAFLDILLLRSQSKEAEHC